MIPDAATADNHQIWHCLTGNSKAGIAPAKVTSQHGLPDLSQMTLSEGGWHHLLDGASVTELEFADTFFGKQSCNASAYPVQA